MTIFTGSLGEGDTMGGSYQASANRADPTGSWEAEKTGDRGGSRPGEGAAPRTAPSVRDRRSLRSLRYQLAVKSENIPIR